MIISALIAQLRTETGDNPKSMQVQRDGDAVTTLYNLGSFPVMEGSYSLYKGTSAQTEGADYSIDKDNGDVSLVAATASNISNRMDFKYAHWRNNDWVNAINNGIEELNARGFFRQVVRNTSVMALSANVRVYSAPSACIDLYEVLTFSDRTISGSYSQLQLPWEYQQDANKLLLGDKPYYASKLAVSYLRNMQTYVATSATIDVLNDWIVLVKKKAKAEFYSYMAGKIAKQGNATIDEGHFSFTNCRTMMVDLNGEFDLMARRKKPTRAAKNLQYHIEGKQV